MARRPSPWVIDGSADRGVGARIQRGGRAVAGMLTIATAGGGIVKLSRIRLTDPQDDALESRREPGMLGVDHRDSA